eukprot:9485954-Pyramimonas_sp.AAC.2
MLGLSLACCRPPGLLETAEVLLGDYWSPLGGRGRSPGPSWEPLGLFLRARGASWGHLGGPFSVVLDVLMTGGTSARLSCNAFSTLADVSFSGWPPRPPRRPERLSGGPREAPRH